jgi:hypothetical protein
MRPSLYGALAGSFVESPIRRNICFDGRNGSDSFKIKCNFLPDRFTCSRFSAKNLTVPQDLVLTSHII